MRGRRQRATDRVIASMQPVAPGSSLLLPPAGTTLRAAHMSEEEYTGSGTPGRLLHLRSESAPLGCRSTCLCAVRGYLPHEHYRQYMDRLCPACCLEYCRMQQGGGRP